MSVSTMTALAGTALAGTASAGTALAGTASAGTASAGRRLPALAFGVTLGVFASCGAWAQSMLDSPAVTTGRANRAAAAVDKPVVAAPDAIPGATARAPAAPATKGAGDLQPTDALFDAINRGDIAAARDALNRGADLDGVNILGMTPMELSVDLSRNDISFLLLSMRGEDSGRGSRATGRDTPAPAPTGKTARTGKPGAAAKVVASKPAPAKTPVAGKAVTPKLFANDGGAPLPSAGFLGFDSRSASN
jgi:hypothetical protein